MIEIIRLPIEVTVKKIKNSLILSTPRKMACKTFINEVMLIINVVVEVA